MKILGDLNSNSQGSSSPNNYQNLKEVSGIGNVVINLVPDRMAEQDPETLNQGLTHRPARDYLAQGASTPLLDKSMLTPEDIEAIELKSIRDSRAYQCLTAIALYYHQELELQNEVKEWFFENYAISQNTVSDLKIGFVPASEDLITPIEALRSQGFSQEEIVSTGAFVKSGIGLVCLFRGRITFPYWSRDRGVVYMIGGSTPWTFHRGHGTATYKKLMAHSEKFPYVRKCIDDSIFYNEDCLVERPETIVIVEGITDAIGAIERGFSVISPATDNLKDCDQQSLYDTLRGFSGKIIVVPNNEISQTGRSNALETAKALSIQGLDARIAQLPLGPKQDQARKSLLLNYGFEEHTPEPVFITRLETIKDKDELDELNTLLKDSRIDLNEFFKHGHTAGDFRKVLDQASTPLELAIAKLNPDLKGMDRSKAINTVLLEVSYFDPALQDHYLKLLRNRLGDTSLDTLKKQLAKIEEEQPESSRERKEKFNKLLELFYHFNPSVFRDQYGYGWVTMWFEDHYENISLRSEKFEDKMLEMFFSEYQQPVNGETIKRVGQLLRSRSRELRPLYTRYAWKGDRLFIDMGTDDWKVIEVTAEGWTITKHDKPVFKRYSHMLPLAEPKRNGDIHKALDYFSVKDPGNQALLLVWLCTAMFEHMGRSGLILHGTHGSAKTTAADFLRTILDPSVIPHSILSKDLHEFAQYMDHHAVLNLDNLSELPQWASNALCSATTGGGFQKRQLYTDDQDIVYFFRRVFILNGLSIPTTAPDLLDRALLVEFTRISKKNRKWESKLRKSFESDLPDILGGILDVMVEVIARRHEEFEELPRMADWYGMACIAADTLGVKEEFLRTFEQSEKRQHWEVIESHIVSQLLLEFMDGRDSWNGKHNDLYSALNIMAEEQGIKRGWPKRSNVFGKELKKLAHNLSEIGIHIATSRDRQQRMISINRSESPEEEKP